MALRLLCLRVARRGEGGVDLSGVVVKKPVDQLALSASRVVVSMPVVLEATCAHYAIGNFGDKSACPRQLTLKLGDAVGGFV